MKRFSDQSTAPQPKTTHIQQPTPIQLISFNVNGIRNFANTKKLLWDFVESSHADIICLQEVRVASNQVGEFTTGFKARGYSHVKWNCCKAKKGAYGVMTASKLPFISHSTDFPGEDIEGRFLVTELEHFVLVNLYVVNSGRKLVRLDYRIQWDERLRGYLKSLQKPIVIAGDLNVAHQEIDIANPNSNRNKSAGFTDQERESFSTLLAELNVVDVYRHLYPDAVAYTYWSNFNNSRARNIGWRLDYFVVSETLLSMVKDCGMMSDQKGSDHCPIYLKMEI
ncbi:hypothetical protein P9112_004564 [Eukaryota sp. TZLM1-RC]